MRVGMMLLAVGTALGASSALAQLPWQQQAPTDVRRPVLQGEPAREPSRPIPPRAGGNDYAPPVRGVADESQSVYFDFSSATIKSSERRKLDRLIRTIKESPAIESVDIIGHTDPVGGVAVNRALSQKRAATVEKYLRGKGVKVSAAEITGLGALEPAVRCDPEMPRSQLITCLKSDRRVEVRFNYR